MSEQVQQAAEAHAAAHQHQRRVGTYIGAALLTAGIASGAAIGAIELSGDNHTIAQEVPYMPEAQAAVNSIDGGLADFGAIAFPLALTTIGAVKVAARNNSRAAWIDQMSSKEPTADGSARPGMVRRAMAATLTSRFPAIPVTAAMVGAMTAGIAAEVSEGPNRPIQALDAAVPGESMVVPYADLMPMAQGAIDPETTEKIQQSALAGGVKARPLALSLGVMRAPGREPATDLVLGIDQPTSSPADWSLGQGCRSIPVIVDSAARLATGTHIELNGVSATVAGRTENTSAINRVGVIMDREAVQICIDRQQPERGTNHAVVLDASPEKAAAIVREAGLENAVDVITKQRYVENSKDFWVKNVKPITSVLEGISGLMALVALTGSITARLERNRRELASKLARGFGTQRIRAAEMVRTAKEGVIASAVGSVAAIPATIAVNATELGFKAGIGLHEMLVGTGIAMASVVGSLVPLARLRKKLDPTRFTR